MGWTARPEQVDALIDGVRAILAGRPDVAQQPSVVGATGLGLDGVEVGFTAYLAAATATEERAARHAILRDVLALAHRLGLPGCKDLLEGKAGAQEQALRLTGVAAE